MRTPWALVRKHLAAHWVRSLLTMLAMTFALFLFCFVRSVVTSLDQAVNAAAANRLVVQSAVSLFVNLPLDYQAKIASIPGVASCSKMQWFGGYWKSEDYFFAQFAVDHEIYFDMYEEDMRLLAGPDLSIADGDDPQAVREDALDAFAADRRAAIIGIAHTRPPFEWALGDTVPIIPRIFTTSDGAAWEFVVVGVYEPTRSNVDDRTLWFRWDYFQETLESDGLVDDELGVGVFVVNVADGHDPATVIEAIDGMFAAGPQATKTTTEAAFQAIFVSMLGNVPRFMGTIGGAIVFAVMFSVVNTMLMAARQRRQDHGILKALGFGDGAVARLMLAEALVLALAGGGLGLLVAKAGEEPLRRLLGSNLPGYAVQMETLVLGAGVALAVGVVAGLGPAVAAARVRPADALRSEG